MLILSFCIFLISFAGALWMVVRTFPELAGITVMRHKHFLFLGIEDIHVLEYKLHSEVIKKDFLIFLEKTLRRIRSLILKLDNAISQGIEKIQQKTQAIQTPQNVPDLPSDLSKIKNLSLLSQKPKEDNNI